MGLKCILECVFCGQSETCDYGECFPVYQEVFVPLPGWNELDDKLYCPACHDIYDPLQQAWDKARSEEHARGMADFLMRYPEYQEKYAKLHEGSQDQDDGQGLSSISGEV